MSITPFINKWQIIKGRKTGNWILYTDHAKIGFSRGSFEEIIALAKYLKRGQIEAQKRSVRSVSDSTGFSGNRPQDCQPTREVRPGNGYIDCYLD